MQKKNKLLTAKRALAVLLLVIFLLPEAAVFADDGKVVNVLCYHRFKKRKITDKIKKKWGDIYYLNPAMFEEHIKFIKKNYSIISMNKYLMYLDGQASIPDRSVVITIDDGYKSVYTKAFPILKKYEVPAIVYLYQDFIPGGRNALTFDEVKEMMREGIEFGCHSKSHPILTSKWKNRNNRRKKRKMDDAEYVKMLEKEIIGSKIYLEDNLRVPMSTFAYPYGTYSKEVHHFIKKAGYKAAFSVVASYNTRDTYRYALKRTMIYNSTSIEKLKKILEKKPIKVTDIYPADGDVIEDRTPELKAVIAADSHLNTATIKFKMGRVVIKDSQYNPTTGQVTHYYKKKISSGTHTARVVAKGLDGTDYEYAWLFIIGKPTKMTLLAGEKNGISDEVKQEAGQ